jgi:hypothetical protein
MVDHIISIAENFSRYPGPRYRQDGPNSGQQFREEILIPALQDARNSGGVVSVGLDGVAGYGSSFLEEVFGGLLRSGFSKEDIDRHLRIVAKTNRFQHHKVRAQSYISEEAQRQGLAPAQAGQH